jgi:hypothetical protein
MFDTVGVMNGERPRRPGELRSISTSQLQPDRESERKLEISGFRRRPPRRAGRCRPFRAL